MMNFFSNFFSEILVFFNSVFGNVGVSIIVFTIVIRSLLLPLTLPSIKSSKKIKELQPKLKKLKEKHKNDKQAYALAQAQLYKSYNINPMAGCLPQILQLFILIVLYRSITSLFTAGGDLNFSFLWADLSQPDSRYIFPVLAAASQFILSLMLSPATQTRDIVPNDSKKLKVKAANAKEEDMAEMAASMQQQMMFMMPIMTGVIALRLPAGLALYWIMGTVFTLFTQVAVSGWGGIAVFWNKNIAKGALAKLQLAESRGEKLIEKQVKVKKKKIKTNPLLEALASSPKKNQANSDLASLLMKKGASTEPLKAKNARATKVKISRKVKSNRSSAKKARKAAKNKRK